MIEPYIKLETSSGTNIDNAIRKACHIATTLQVPAHFKIGREEFEISPGTDPDEAVNAYNN